MRHTHQIVKLDIMLMSYHFTIWMTDMLLMQGVAAGSRYILFPADPFLSEHVEVIQVSDDDDNDSPIDQCDLKIHVYQCHQGENINMPHNSNI